MNRVFEPRGYITVPDGTEVSAFLNATDESQPDVPWGALGEMSVAAGRIHPGRPSRIHVHPAVTQITYCVSGRLETRMREAGASEPYVLEVEAGQAVVSEPGTLLQLAAPGDEVAEVLYIVSPSYVFEMAGDRIVHDDAIPVADGWDEIEAKGEEAPTPSLTPYEARALRAEAHRRLAARKGQGPAPLDAEAVVSLPEAYDHLAPDGSEIRLLVGGENGGLCHCVLRRGRVSAPVRHRTIEELWYVLEGSGEVWRGRDAERRIDPVRAGDSVRIPVGTSFQFRAGDSDLKLLLATMPPWPGPQEAVAADGEWAPGASL